MQAVFNRFFFLYKVFSNLAVEPLIGRLSSGLR